MTDPNFEDPIELETEPPQYGVGPVTIRELSLVAIWLVAFVLSFFSLLAFADGQSVWTWGVNWILTIGLPTVAVFLVVLRRFSPDGIRRVGSLGIDQFASVAFSVSAAVWFTMIWQDIATATGRGLNYSWVVWVEFFLMLAGVVLTVLAPFIPPFSQDFRGRTEVVAHRNARPVRAVTARPRPEPVVVPVAPPAYETGETATLTDLGIDSTAAPDEEDAWSPPYARRGGETDVDAAYDDEPAYVAAPFEVEAQADPQPEPAPVTAPSPFWALAPVEREVHDERGIPIFTVGPTAWALVIEDRESVYVIQHEDGRIGYLHDVSGIRRG